MVINLLIMPTKLKKNVIVHHGIWWSIVSISEEGEIIKRNYIDVKTILCDF